MKITAIKAQVKNPERVSIYVDEKYELSLNHAQLLDSKLRVGLEITNEQLETFKQASALGKAYERALIYVMIRPRSVKELRDYCRRKKWSVEDSQIIIDKLTSRRYVDDLGFAKAWVENRALAGKTSLRKLKLELRQKGISDELAAEVLGQTGYDDQAVLHNLINKKRRLSRFQDDQKLMQYLAGQGFSYDSISRVLKKDRG